MDSIRVFCKNTNSYYSCAPGTELKELIAQIGYKENTGKNGEKHTLIAAYVDNKLKELGFKIYMAHSIEFIDITSPDGRRTYMRSLCFLLQKAVYDLFGTKYKLVFDYSLPNGLYGELHYNELTEKEISEFRERGSLHYGPALMPKIVPLYDEDIVKIKGRMDELIKKDSLFVKRKMNLEESVSLFLQHGQIEKARLVKNMGCFFNSVYFLDGYGDTFYGPMLHSSGDIVRYDLVKYNEGFCLQGPQPFYPYDLPAVVYQEKLKDIFTENARWCRILGAKDISSVNMAIQKGYASKLIMIAEALHERKYADIADMIYARRERVKLVLLSGPSSSGKTTTSKRLAVQLKVLGLNPVVLEMDNYFVDRERTPKDEDGKYDFESIYAMDLELLNRQLSSLLAGEAVEIPKFNFAEGKSMPSGNVLKLQEQDILIMEGIHALNPQLTAGIDDGKKFRIYASALTSLSIDENNYISTTDNRMLRRMVRDNNFRGTSAEDTILRWQSVRRGEYKNIFPYQENADIMFNSSLIYELPLLKHYAEPLLRRISPLSEAYSESLRLLKFLSYITEMNPKEQRDIPPTSVMREFIGESTFTY